MIRELMTQEARLALAAYGCGDVPKYEMHRANARRLADHLEQQEAQERRRAARAVDHTAPGLLCGRAFWIGGGACVAAWSLFLGRAVGLF